MDIVAREPSTVLFRPFEEFGYHFQGRKEERSDENFSFLFVINDLLEFSGGEFEMNVSIPSSQDVQGRK